MTRYSVVTHLLVSLSAITDVSEGFVAVPTLTGKLASRVSRLGRSHHAGATYMRKSTAKRTHCAFVALRMSLPDMTFGCGDPIEEAERLDALVEAGHFRLWKSAWTTDGVMRPFTVTDQMLEQRSSGKINDETLGLQMLKGIEGGTRGEIGEEDAGYATLAVAAACLAWCVGAFVFLPDSAVRNIMCAVLVLIPVLFSVLSNKAPELIASSSPFLQLPDDDPMNFDRTCRHEAAHFLCGYLCGQPIRVYAVSGETHLVSFYWENNLKESFDEDQIATRSVVDMAGGVAEILQDGVARHNKNDLRLLGRHFQRSKQELESSTQLSLTRWGALTAYKLISANRDKYEALVQAMKEERSVSECVAVLES